MSRDQKMSELIDKFLNKVKAKIDVLAKEIDAYKPNIVQMRMSLLDLHLLLMDVEFASTSSLHKFLTLEATLFKEQENS